MATAPIVDNLVRVLERHVQVRCDEVCWLCDNAELRFLAALALRQICRPAPNLRRDRGLEGVQSSTDAEVYLYGTDHVGPCPSEGDGIACCVHTHLQVNASQFPYSGIAVPFNPTS